MYIEWAYDRFFTTPYRFKLGVKKGEDFVIFCTLMHTSIAIQDHASDDRNRWLDIAVTYCVNPPGKEG